MISILAKTHCVEALADHRLVVLRKREEELLIKETGRTAAPLQEIPVSSCASAFKLEKPIRSMYRQREERDSGAFWETIMIG